MKVVSLVGAKDSSLLAIFTAPLKSGSSSLAATQAAKVFSGSFTGLKAIECDRAGSLSSLTAFITELAKLRL